VEKYSGCKGDAVKKVADTIASQFADGYAVAAVLAADWLGRKECSSGEVEKAVERARRDVRRFALDYIWHVVLGEDENVARWAAPLILATGFYGPHPPKLGESVAVAMSRVVEEIFGRGSVRRDDNVLKWLTQPLHGILYETTEKVTHSAVSRRFGVGSDELCQGSQEESCRLVEICSKVLKKVSQKRYSVEEVAEEYAKVVAKKLEAPGPDGERQIDFLIDDFLRAFNGVAENGRWRIRYEVEMPEGDIMVEDVVDELDVLSALYGLAVLPVWYLVLKPLEGWFFVNGAKIKVIDLYLYPLLKERSEELVKKAMTIIHKILERNGAYTVVDVLRAVGIAAAGHWAKATDEELGEAAELAAIAFHHFAIAIPIVLENVKPLLSETWRRVVKRETYEDGGKYQRLVDVLISIIYSAVRGHPPSSLHFFIPEMEEPDPETVVKRFAALYNAASNAGKLRLLEVLIYALDWEIGGANVAAVLLGNPQLSRWEAIDEVARRVEEFVSHLHGVERAYAVARLYPQLAVRYTTKAVGIAEEALKALEELWMAYEKDITTTREELRPYLELMHVKPDLGWKLNTLRKYVYHHVALVYMYSDELDKAVKYAEKACELARKFGEVYDEVSSCSLPSRLKVVRDGTLPIKEFEELWQKASLRVIRMGAEDIATALSEYVVALASASRLSDVEKTLEEWGWALELYPDTSTLTYGVLSLFDRRYLEMVAEGIPERARANLPKFADVLHDAVETGLFAEDPEIITSAMETLMLVHGKDVAKALVEIGPSRKLFLSALVGLAYCKRGEKWGLKLAKAAARAGSQLSKGGIDGRLFDELARALENATAGNCVTEEVLRAVYKLYYFHV